jgi:hypothetical protein
MYVYIYNACLVRQHSIVDRHVLKEATALFILRKRRRIDIAARALRDLAVADAVAVAVAFADVWVLSARPLTLRKALGETHRYAVFKRYFVSFRAVVDAYPVCLRVRFFTVVVALALATRPNPFLWVGCLGVYLCLFCYGVSQTFIMLLAAYLCILATAAPFAHVLAISGACRRILH